MKKGIIINETNEQKITAILNNVQKNCTARTVTIEQVFKATERMEEYREKHGIAKKNMEGVTVEVNLHKERYPKAYKYTPEGTVFEMLYKNGKWRLLYCYRGNCDGSENKRYTVNLLYRARKDVLDHASVF